MARKPAEPIEALHWVGEPKRLCGNCEHYERLKAGKSVGKCHNGISQRFKTSAGDSACLRGFYPDVERFPLHERLGIKPA